MCTAAWLESLVGKEGSHVRRVWHPTLKSNGTNYELCQKQMAGTTYYSLSISLHSFFLSFFLLSFFVHSIFIFYFYIFLYLYFFNVLFLLRFIYINVCGKGKGPGVLSVELDTVENAFKFQKALRLFTDATSLGGYESLIDYRYRYALNFIYAHFCV